MKGVASNVLPNRDPALKHPPGLKHASHHHHKMCDKYVKSKRIDAAVAAIRRGEFSDYAKAAKEYKCNRGAVSRQIRGLTKSKKEADSFANILRTNKKRF